MSKRKTWSVLGTGAKDNPKNWSSLSSSPSRPSPMTMMCEGLCSGDVRALDR